ncbi:PDR/VanB family oxidoreductase [Lentzea cavernae]|uniref:Ferredoxin n=1 Tax=Lentzea cavernae TaxID=2020703 RepID=A0ABQ3MLQ5_9PSEU|nr:PDR/VanB family oxidoreductase [Lentzea cavernae]GHH48056.1 ferredoxin [Lentzea cavernae]
MTISPSITTPAITIAARTPVATGVIALTLVPADGQDLPPWRPGAHVDVTLPSGLTRQYSLCGDPADRSSWRIAILLAQPSRGGSAWIHDHAREGVPLTVSAPRNLFTLEAAERYVFVAGGIGITPLLPMITEAERAGVPWTLWYGGRSRSSTAFTDELIQFGDRVHLVPRDTAGRIPITEVLDTPGAGTAVYCCGPESMIDAVQDACRDWEPGTVHVERFTPEAQEGTTAFDVHCARSGVDVRVEEGVSVLDALLEAGVEADYSCAQGFCGTCETRVVEGVPDHRDDYLDHSAAPDTMMICVSRSRCARLVLDL